MMKAICGLLIFLGVVMVTVCYGDVETEPNDGVETANPLTVGIEMNGQLASSSDQDWFSIHAGGPGFIDINFAYSADSYTVTVKDGMGNVLSQVEPSGSGPYMSFSVGVWTTGTYYVIITGSQSDPYVLTADFDQTFNRLDISVDPDGTGQILPDCSSGCFYDVTENTVESLTAVPDPGYVFNSWSGDCTGSELSTTVVMNSSKNCTANFSACGSPPAKNGNSALYYNSIQEAYDDAAHIVDGDTIEMLAGNIVESPLFDADITITLSGGHDCAFARNASSTSIEGTVTIERGSIIVQKVLIR